jgi:hypothetical protein
MGIDYLSGIQPGMKIDLNRFERPKQAPPRPESFLMLMKEKLAVKAEEYNRIHSHNWLNSDGSINLPEHPDWEKDELIADEQEKQWAAESGKSREQWLIDKEKNPASLTEMALTLSLQRLLPERFMVVRSARYDDYNGVDQLIIDRANGSVVCGIDEVIDREGNTGPSKKEEKIRKKMLNGGAKVKYGVRVEGGSLQLGNLKNVPAFYLSLSPSELAILCQDLSQDEATPTERELFSRLRSSLSQQIKSYESLPLDRNLKANVALFAQSLEAWSE